MGAARSTGIGDHDRSQYCLQRRSRASRCERRGSRLGAPAQHESGDEVVKRKWVLGARGKHAVALRRKGAESAGSLLSMGRASDGARTLSGPSLEYIAIQRPRGRRRGPLPPRRQLIDATDEVCDQGGATESVLQCVLVGASVKRSATTAPTARAREGAAGKLRRPSAGRKG